MGYLWSENWWNVDLTLLRRVKEISYNKKNNIKCCCVSVMAYWNYLCLVPLSQSHLLLHLTFIEGLLTLLALSVWRVPAMWLSYHEKHDLWCWSRKYSANLRNTEKLLFAFAAFLFPQSMKVAVLEVITWECLNTGTKSYIKQWLLIVFKIVKKWYK